MNGTIAFAANEHKIYDVSYDCYDTESMKLKKFLIGCGGLSLILLVIGVIGFAVLAALMIVVLYNDVITNVLLVRRG